MQFDVGGPDGAILLVAGTRPEIIKLAPVYGALIEAFGEDRVNWLDTGQHATLGRDTLATFGIAPTHQLAHGTGEVTLPELTERLTREVGGVLDTLRPALVVVQGDTASAYAGAMAAFHRGVPIAHVEAGLRTYDIREPYPEEAYRRMIDVVSTLRFPPTPKAAAHLRAEGCAEDTICITGNTTVDAIALAEGMRAGHAEVVLPGVPAGRLLFVTLHRRESWGAPLEAMCHALVDIVERFADVQIVLPLHVNPRVQEVVRRLLGGRARITLVPPLDFASCQAVMSRAHLILTDSGGIQEEAPSHGVPVLVLRRATERPEAVDDGLAVLTGTGRQEIVEMASRLLDDTELHARMRNGHNPFGDGRAAARIARAIGRYFKGQRPLLPVHEQFGASPAEAAPRRRTLGAVLRAGALALVAGLGLNLGLADTAAAAAPVGCAQAPDAQVATPYAIQVTWMFPRDTACEWQQVLQSFHRMGGRAVLQFAPALQPLRREELADCRDDEGRPCVEAATQDLAARGIGAGRIAQWLFVESPESHGDAVVCPGSELDRKIQVRRGGVVQTGWRLVLRHDDAGSSCDRPAGRVSVLFVLHTPASRAQPALMEIAEALGMEVYLGAPAFAVLPHARWQADPELAPAMLDWSERVFRDFGRRYGERRSFKGVYQTFEVALQPAWKGDGYDLYGRQAKLLHAVLPGRHYAVSPYFYVNRRQQGTDLAGTVDGFRRMARAGVDIIMPQDGRGTGKAALFWPWQRHLPVNSVDPQLGRFAHVDGRATLGEQFAASTGEMYAALRQAAGEMAARERVNVRLWPNVEAFEEDVRDPAFVACGSSGLSQTTKARLDRAITFAGPAERVVSFMYDPLFTCSERHGTTLGAAIAADHDRPLAVHAALDAQAESALVVEGHHLLAPGSRFEIVAHDAAGRTAVVTARVQQVLRSGGAALQRVRLAFDAAALGAAQRLAVVAIAPDGRRAHEALVLDLPRVVTAAAATPRTAAKVLLAAQR